MIGEREFGLFSRAALVGALIVSVGLFEPATGRAKHPGESPDAANAFLDRFIGHWIGEGTADGTPIQEDLVCERVLSGTFLRMQDREINGGNFQADTYLGYRGEESRYELYSFNNNTAFG